MECTDICSTACERDETSLHAVAWLGIGLGLGMGLGLGLGLVRKMGALKKLICAFFSPS